MELDPEVEQVLDLLENEDAKQLAEAGRRFPAHGLVHGRID